MQQVSIAHSLSANGGIEPRELSDHMGVTVDLNLSTTQCNVTQAREVSVDGRPVTLNGRIEHSGGLQWYQLDGPGSYRIGFGDNSRPHGLELSVYSDTGVSRPIEPRSVAPVGDGVLEYELSATSYLRVGDPRRLASGDYTIRLARIDR